MLNLNDHEIALIDQLVDAAEQQPDGETRRLLEVVEYLAELLGPRWRDRLRRGHPALYSDVKAVVEALKRIEFREWLQASHVFEQGYAEGVRDGLFDLGKLDWSWPNVLYRMRRCVADFRCWWGGNIMEKRSLDCA